MQLSYALTFSTAPAETAVPLRGRAWAAENLVGARALCSVRHVSGKCSCANQIRGV